MARTILPPQSVLNQLFRYEPDTGALFWRPRPIEDFKSAQAWKAWNTKYAGKPALSAKTSSGYSGGKANGVCLSKHRVIWKMVNGSEPTVIDHEDGDKGNDRLSNLRNGTKKDNTRNRKIPSNNTSGVMGVSWRKDCNRWESYIRDGGKHVRIGYFTSLDEAVKARKAAETKLGYHANHGRIS